MLQCDAMEDGEVLNLANYGHDEKSEFHRGLASLYDLNYLLAVVPTAAQWNNQMRTSFKSGVSKMLEILSMMQGMVLLLLVTPHHLMLMLEPQWPQLLTMLQLLLLLTMHQLLQLFIMPQLLQLSIMLQLLFMPSEDMARLIIFIQLDPSSPAF